MTYDPSRKRSKVPPQLRAWVFGRRKKGKHDPSRKGMAMGYGAASGKPYRVGSRRGVYWSASRVPRYDVPARKASVSKVRGILGKVENNLQWIGLALGILIPAEMCRAKTGNGLKEHYINGTINDTKRLFGVITAPGWGPAEYVAYKFTHPNSTWTIAFWGSLGAQVLARIGAFKLVSVRANTAIKKLTTGTLIASIIGGLFMQGGEAHTSSNPAAATNRNVNTPLSYYG